MNTIFIGGSRRVSRLPAQAKERLSNVIGSGFDVIVGDANGADKAVQKYLLEAAYEKVTVFCSGEQCRNNLGKWPTRNVQAPKSAKGFQFYATKDREMAREADFGLMFWDGKSAGTILNVLRLIGAGKKVVLLNVPAKSATSFKTANDWERFLRQFGPDFRHGLRERATPEEWRFFEPPRQSSFLNTFDAESISPRHIEDHAGTDEKLTADINSALASGDPTRVVDALGSLARARGMTQVAKETGLARESLYRALSASGNPKLATVLKILNAVGLRLMVTKESPSLVEEQIKLNRTA
jgi:adenine-specific DNA-methyltransferase